MAKSQAQEHREAIQKASEQLEPKIVKISEELTCDLTEDEWRNRAKDLASAHQEAEAQEERKKSITAELNADLKIAKAKESKLAGIVATRSERREVTVELKYDYEQGRVIRTRTDTNEVISDREMTDNERQAELDLSTSVDANDFIEQERKAERDAEDAADIDEGEVDDLTEEDLEDERSE